MGPEELRSWGNEMRMDETKQLLLHLNSQRDSTAGVDGQRLTMDRWMDIWQLVAAPLPLLVNPGKCVFHVQKTEIIINIPAHYIL